MILVFSDSVLRRGHQKSWEEYEKVTAEYNRGPVPLRPLRWDVRHAGSVCATKHARARLDHDANGHQRR